MTLLTKQELMEELNLSDYAMSSLLKQYPDLPRIQIKRRYMFDLEMVQDFLKEKMTGEKK